MQKKIKHIFYTLSLLTALLPVMVYAQVPADTQRGLTGISGLFGNAGGFLRFNDASSALTFIIRVLLMFAGMIAIIYIILGGYRMITSAGDPKKHEAGVKTVTYAAIGIAVIVLAYVLVNAVVNIVTRPPVV